MFGLSKEAILKIGTVLAAVGAVVPQLVEGGLLSTDQASVAMALVTLLGTVLGRSKVYSRQTFEREIKAAADRSRVVNGG